MKIAIAPDRYAIGCSDLRKDSYPLELKEFPEAFRESYQTAAHFFTYEVPGLDSFPRLNKDVLPQIREAGSDVLTTIFCLDYDTPGHVEWTQAGLDEFLGTLIEKEKEGFSPAVDWTLFYTTKRGARFVYVLDKPIKADLGEAYCKGLVRDFVLAGIPIDASCAEWTRCFLLPRVIREGEKENTGISPFFLYQENLESRLNPLSIIPLSSNVEDVIVEFNDPKPDSNCTALLWEPGKIGERDTPWHRKARKRLTNRECFKAVFENVPIAAPGHRMKTIHSYLGEATGLLFGIEGTSPVLLYALFLPSVSQLDPDKDNKDWTDVLWKAVLRYWSKEVAKYKNQLYELEQKKTDAKSLQYTILEAVKKWCPEVAALEDPGKQLAYISSRLIAVSPNARFFVMQRDGYYDRISVLANMLPSRIRELGMDGIMPLEIPMKETMGFKPVDSQTLLNKYTTTVSSMEGAANIPGAYIRDISKGNSCLISSMYQRKDLPGVFNEQVDTWLRKFFGNLYYDRVAAWIGYALAFEDGPICALSISGPPGLGKKMLVQGLGECIDTECIADAREMANFQSLLFRTPFILMNEGIPKLHHQVEPADEFRKLVAGDPIYITQKYKDTILVRNPIRMILTANNEDMLKALGGGSDLGPDDKEALIIRILHVPCTSGAKDWLNEQGGMNFTRGWIKSDAGSESSYMVARHFLWLYENRKRYQPGNRFLVEGEMNDDLADIIKAKSGSAPTVIEALIDLIENKNRKFDARIVIKDAKFYVTSSAIVDHFRNTIGKYSVKPINCHQVSKVLRSLRPPGPEKPGMMWLNPGNGGVCARWKEIDPGILLREAQEHGYKHEKIKEVFDLQSQMQLVAVQEQQDTKPPEPASIWSKISKPDL